MFNFRDRTSAAKTTAIAVAASFSTGFVALCSAASADEKKSPDGEPTTRYEVAEYKLSPPDGASQSQPLTRVALPPLTDFADGANPDRVLIIQSALVAKGCYDGVLDETWSSRTQGVVARAAKRLSVVVDTTRPSEELIEALLHPRVGDCRQTTVIALSPPDADAAILDDAPVVVRRRLADVVESLRPGRPNREPDSLLAGDPAFVTALQAALVARNCYNGPISGQWTRRTWSALKSFANLSEILIDGSVVRDEILDSVLAFSASACPPRVEKHPGRRKVGVAKSRSRSKRQNRKYRKTKHRVAVRRGRAPAVFARPVGVGRF